jgi:hypothetical protein
MQPVLALLALTGMLVPAAVPPADTGPVLEWNAVALRTTAAAPFNPPLESRNLALVHAAMFDAANAFAGEYQPYAVRLRPPPGALREAAVVAAAHDTLVGLYPEQAANLDALSTGSLRRLTAGPPREAGIAFGAKVARQMLAIRASDGARDAMAAPYRPPSGPGAWVPAPPALKPALDPGWGSITPFLLRSGAQFRPGPPPSLTSDGYTADFQEVQRMGSATSTTRTAAQTQLARLWVSTASQVWNSLARQLIEARRLGPAAAARSLALLNMAMSDAFVASWDAKYLYGQWRPITAIRGADADGNPRTQADLTWTPLLPTPPFPDYVAGHTACAGAAEGVLVHVFGPDPGVSLQLNSPDLPGVVLHPANVQEVARGVVDARVWGGVHWRTSSEEGLRLGRAIGRFGVERFLRPVTGSAATAERDHEGRGD